MIHYILCVCVKSNGEEKYGTNCVKMVYFIVVGGVNGWGIVCSKINYFYGIQHNSLYQTNLR